jgi:hypothetical protein
MITLVAGVGSLKKVTVPLLASFRWQSVVMCYLWSATVSVCTIVL